VRNRGRRRADQRELPNLGRFHWLVFLLGLSGPAVVARLM
jgi:hypothetical protein